MGAGQPLVSVIILSHGRPDELQLCLTAVGQQLYSNFEIIVVADPVGVAAVAHAGLIGRVKTVPFEALNISAARNAGVAVAAGDVVAFIDDDAVPDPMWLAHLVTPFAEAAVVAAGGAVWNRVTGGNDGADMVQICPVGQSIAHGANCAFRRDALCQIGGFDPNFRYHLEMDDVQMRLAGAGAMVAVVPIAQVYHSVAENGHRNAKQKPTSLYETGASIAVYHRKHLAADIADKLWQKTYRDRHSDLMRAVARRKIKPAEVGHLIEGLHKGYTDGQKRVLSNMKAIPPANEPALAYNRHPQTGDVVTLEANILTVSRLRKKAREQVLAGNVVVLKVFSPFAASFSTVFHPDGYWVVRYGFTKDRREHPVKLETMT